MASQDTAFAALQSQFDSICTSDPMSSECYNAEKAVHDYHTSTYGTNVHVPMFNEMGDPPSFDTPVHQATPVRAVSATEVVDSSDSTEKVLRMIAIGLVIGCIIMIAFRARRSK